MHQISLRIALAMIPALVMVLTLFSAATAAREGEVIELEMQRDADAVAASVAALVDPEDLTEARERLSALGQSLAHLTIELAPVAPPAVDSRVEVVSSASLAPDGSGPFVVVREPLAERDAFVRRALITDALGVLAATLMAAAFAVAVGRVLVQGRVLQLVDRLRAVGDGNYDAEPLALGEDEIGELGREVDQMTQQLRRARDHAAEELAARRRAQLQLRRADRLASVGRTVAVFAHEIGTPLAVIAGRAQRLERPPHSEKTRADAGVIREQADRITGFIRRLLDFARHDDSLEFTAIPLGTALQGAYQLAVQRARAANVTVLLDDRAPSATVDGDNHALVQVFTNLIHNAVDASPEGSTVRLVAQEVVDCHQLNLDSAHLHVTVEDEGPGISEALRDRVFDPFFTTKPADEGTGLGLSIVSEIVHDHGGRVTLGAEEASGCRIVVHLPISGSPLA